MHKVHLYEEKCCAPSTGDQLAESLAEHFGDGITVRSYDLRNPGGSVPFPSALLLKLDAGDFGCLPAMVVDSTVVTEGWLPTVDEAVRLVETGQPAVTARPSQGQAEHGCCGGDQACGTDQACCG
jgi:hypothetical protein